MADMNIKNLSTNANAVGYSSSSKEIDETENNISVFGQQIDEETLGVVLAGAVDALLGDGSFTKDEASIYVAGEKEIAELVKNEPNKQNLIETFFDPDKTEREIREKYSSEHPEYASVMKEGQKVQSDFDNAKEETRLKWIEDNPAPEMLKEGGFFGVTMTDEYKDWLKNQDNYMNNFEKEYVQNNPDYANLKAEQDKNKSLLEIILGL